MVTLPTKVRDAVDFLIYDVFNLPHKAPSEPNPTFLDALHELYDADKFAKNQECPNCHKKAFFHVIDYERGRDGWGFTVVCVCGFQGVVTPSGFRFTQAGPYKR